MFESGLIEPEKLKALFDQIEPFLYKFPAVEPRRFSTRVIDLIDQQKK